MKKKKKKKYEKPEMSVKKLKVFFAACQNSAPCTPLRHNC